MFFGETIPYNTNMAFPKDLTGKVSFRLTALRRSNRKANGTYFWLCRCECGTEIEVRASAFNAGNTKSCGCLKAEKCIARGKASRTHGDTVNGKPSVEWTLWRAIRTRCENPNSKDFKYWGARGIKVCERWQAFENFLADVGRKPHPSLSLDRWPNNDGDYEPGNVRWATVNQQINNRRPRTDWTFKSPRWISPMNPASPAERQRRYRAAHS